MTLFVREFYTRYYAGGSRDIYVFGIDSSACEFRIRRSRLWRGTLKETHTVSVTAFLGQPKQRAPQAALRQLLDSLGRTAGLQPAEDDWSIRAAVIS